MRAWFRWGTGLGRTGRFLQDCRGSSGIPTATPARPQGSSPRLLDPRGELLDKVVDRTVLLDQLRDLGGGVDDRRVVAPTELLADLGKRAVGELATEVHRDLAGVDDRLRAPVSREFLQADPEALDHRLLDPLDRNLGKLALREDVLQDLLCELNRHRPAGQGGKGNDARERAFELANVRRDSAGDERKDLRVLDVGPVGVNLLAEDGDPRL